MESYKWLLRKERKKKKEEGGRERQSKNSCWFQQNNLQFVLRDQGHPPS